MDEIDHKINMECYCSNLLSLEQNNKFVCNLLSLDFGKWYSVLILVNDSKLESEYSPENTLFVTWLNDPENDEPYKFVIFYDTATGWSQTASYNNNALIC